MRRCWGYAENVFGWCIVDSFRRVFSARKRSLELQSFNAIKIRKDIVQRSLRKNVDLVPFGSSYIAFKTKSYYPFVELKDERCLTRYCRMQFIKML